MNVDIIDCDGEYRVDVRDIPGLPDHVLQIAREDLVAAQLLQSTLDRGAIQAVKAGYDARLAKLEEQLDAVKAKPEPRCTCGHVAMHHDCAVEGDPCGQLGCNCQQYEPSEAAPPLDVDETA